MALKNVVSPSGNAITSGGYTIILTPQSFAATAGRGYHRVHLGATKRGRHSVRLAVLQACRGYSSHVFLNCLASKRGYHRAYRTGQPAVAVYVTAKFVQLNTNATVEQES